MTDIEKIYKCSINPINYYSLVNFVEVYSNSNDDNDFTNMIINYNKKSSNKNIKYKEELLEYLKNTFGIIIDDTVNKVFNIKNNDDKKDFSLVLNTNYNSTMKLTKLFIKECLKDNINFDVQFNIDGETDHSFMINCSGNNIYPYINILNRLKEKYPNIFRDINNVGPLFSTVDDKIGICSNKYGINRFFENRCNELYGSIDYTYMSYIYKNYNERLNHNGNYFPIIKLLTYYVTDEIRSELLESKLSNENFIKKYGFSKDFINDKDNFKSLAKIVQKGLIKRFDNKDYDDLELNYRADDFGQIILSKDKVNKALRRASYEIVKDNKDLKRASYESVKDKEMLHENLYKVFKMSINLINIDNDNFAFDSNWLVDNKKKKKKMF